MRVGALADLHHVKREIEARSNAHVLAETQRAQVQKVVNAQRNLFHAAVGAVQPLNHLRRANLLPAPPQPIPKQQLRDAAEALRESISDTVDISSMLDTDEQLSYRRNGVGPEVTAKLRRGEWTVQRQIDLHGLRSDEARDALAQFISTSHKQGIRCVRVVHGKGLGSPGKAPVLKQKVLRWLVQKAAVLAFVQAAPAQGGAGALLVLLQPVRAG
ncbi:MAG: Smr/MutS family protein [Rhodoferax sp.]|nr:Smr/MutS family protein [Rhodoferax sp.]MCF8208148.1 Smr/MutS family protein [Rhodoferax sp.]